MDILRYFFLLVILMSQSWTYAQVRGSVNAYGANMATKSVAGGGMSSDASETLYIGPGTHIIDGRWEIYAKTIVIDSTAIISGDGTIALYNPSAAGGISSATFIDGNNIAHNIDVNIELNNTSGLQLSDITFPFEVVNQGWHNNGAASTVYLGKDIDLATDGANIFLGRNITGDLMLGANATISNYRPERMVITNNSVLSHLVKKSYIGTFVFPVGIAGGDYTPAEVNNLNRNTIYVSVQDYAASIPAEAPGPGGDSTGGMDRTWHIYASDPDISADVNLQHNISTNQVSFSNASHFVTQWSASTPNTSGDINTPAHSSSWQSNDPASGSTGTLITPAGILAGSDMRSRTYNTLATEGEAEESYFTKNSGQTTPLPVTLVAFKASPDDCDVKVEWASAEESGLAKYNLMHSNDGKKFVLRATVAPQGGNSGYQFIDKAPGSGTHFYRLEMTGTDGKMDISSIAKATLNCENARKQIVVYPNPANDVLRIKGLDPDRSYTIRVVSIDGKVWIRKLSGNAADIELDISGLASALYYLQVQDSADQQNQQYFKITKL